VAKFELLYRARRRVSYNLTTLTLSISNNRYNIINTASENLLAKLQYCSLSTKARDKNFIVNFVQRDRWNLQ